MRAVEAPSQRSLKMVLERFPFCLKLYVAPLLWTLYNLSPKWEAPNCSKADAKNTASDRQRELLAIDRPGQMTNLSIHHLNLNLHNRLAIGSPS